MAPTSLYYTASEIGRYLYDNGGEMPTGIEAILAPLLGIGALVGGCALYNWIRKRRN
jgi:LPXTG-motif cell wall-anchored protein